MTGSEVAVPEAEVPALRDKSQTLTAEDLSFPRLYLGQGLTQAVKDELVKLGDLFLADDQFDPDPKVIAKKGDAKGVVFYVLGFRKGISRSVEGQLDTWQFDDPDAPRYGPGTDAWVSYTYFIAIPGVKDNVPVRVLFSRTSQPAARKINTRLNDLGGAEPHYNQAFRLTSKEQPRKKGGGTYWVYQVAPIEGTDEGRKVAESLSELIERNSERVTAASGDEPAI